MTFTGWRQLVAITLAIVLGVSAFRAMGWVWRDITYWSRSTTVSYKTDSLEECVRLAAADWPDISASFSGPEIMLRTPLQEGVIVKDTPTPKLARIVVFGHSESISHLGPSSEDSVSELLRRLSHDLSLRCGSA